MIAYAFSHQLNRNFFNTKNTIFKILQSDDTACLKLIKIILLFFITLQAYCLSKLYYLGQAF